MEKANYEIRLYQPADRQAIRDICVETCWMGEYRPEAIPDGWLWAEFWTRYFTDADPSLTWVLCRQDTGKVVGYLTAAGDTRAADRYFLRILPGAAWHVLSKGLLLRPGPRRVLFAMIRSLRKGELSLPAEIARDYPATWHFDLLAEARGRAGLLLLRTLLARLRQLGTPGVHGRTLSINHRVNKFLEHMGFTLAHRRAITMFRHFHPQPIDELTWVLNLRGSSPGRV